MKRILCTFLALFCICILFSCKGLGDKDDETTEPSTSEESSGTTDNVNDKNPSPENTTGGSATPPVIKNESDRNSDTVLDVDEIKFDDFNGDHEGYLLIINYRGKGLIYYLRAPGSDPSAQKTWITCYETEKITEGFFNGDAVKVHAAVKNKANLYDYYIFNNRFNSVNTEEISSAATVLKSPGNHVILISLNNNRAFNGTNAALGSALYGDVSKSDDRGLVELMLLIFEDRGFSFQHF